MNKKNKLMVIIVISATILFSTQASGFPFISKVAGKIAGKTMTRTGTKIVPKGITQISSFLTRQSIKNFGKQNIKFLKNIPRPDLRRLNAYAAKADSQKTKDALISYYKNGGTGFLNTLSWKEISAIGLSTAMIIAAYQTSDGVQEGMHEIARNSPEVFGKTISDIGNHLTMPFMFSATLFLVGFSSVWLLFYYRKKKQNLTKRRLVLTASKQNNQVNKGG